MVEWLFYQLPWWLQVGLLAIPVGGLVWIAGMLFGWDKVRPLIVPLAGILAAIGLASRFKQQGYADRIEVEKKAEDQAEKKVEEIRTDTESKSDQEVADETDRWTRP